MKQGDFSTLAKDYIHRAGYSILVLSAIAAHIGALREGFNVADVGAGTGKLTNNLGSIGMRGYAVEPNDAMRQEGIRLNQYPDRFQWLAGSAESTGLPDNSIDWVLMGSSFHWTNSELALREFCRILKPGGYFTAVWNPRDLDRSELHKRIETKIHEIVPELKRVSSGSSRYTHDLDEKLVSFGSFHNLIFIEAPHEEHMTKDRYLGAWRSVNDIQAQAGPVRFGKIIDAIVEEISDLDIVTVPYKTRAWTVQLKQ